METYAETSLKPSSGILFCRQYSIMKLYNSSEVFGNHLEMGLNCALFKSYKEKKNYNYNTVLHIISAKIFVTITTEALTLP
jgi:hypothetical protein